MNLESLIPKIRPDVADWLDTTTQLETLGYNRYRSKRLFDLDSTFELGQQLFKIIPKQRFLPTLKSSSKPLLKHALIIVGMSLLAISNPTQWFGFLALFCWTVVFGQLFSQILDASKTAFGRLYTLAWISGVLLIAMAHFIQPLEFKTLCLLLVWCWTSLSFWKTPRSHWHFFVLLLLAGLSLFWTHLGLVLLLAFGLVFAHRLEQPKQSTWNYLKDQSWDLLFWFMYGLGQAYLLWSVLSSPRPWPGLIALGLIVLISEWLESVSIDELKHLLWHSRNREDYHARLFSSLGFWIQIMLLVALIATLLIAKTMTFIPLPVLGASFLGLAIGLSFFLLRLEESMFVAFGFFIATLLVFFGLPLWLVMLGLVLFFLTGMMLIIMRVERAGLSIL
jgi:hypothetical protein